MKICGIICEYNPFHNGHIYHITEAKRRSGADAIVCILGEHFTQRGEAAVLPAAVRAKHAILGGADAVISLPAVFATSPAEIFARGAISILSSLPAFSFLSFGAEHADSDFFAAAEILNDESSYAETMKKYLSQGDSFALSREKALKGTAAFPLLSSPNDVLALEYARALLPKKRDVTLLPVERIGAYKKEELTGSISSAAAIRAAVKNGCVPCAETGVPDFTANDLSRGYFDQSTLLAAEKISLLKSPRNVLAATLDCTEGLENALFKAAGNGKDVIKALTSRRYTASRIRRICLQNLLGIRRNFIDLCLTSPLYIKPLAVKKGREDVLSALAAGSLPCVIRHADEIALSGVAKKCFETEKLAQKIYSAVTNRYDGTNTLFY